MIDQNLATITTNATLSAIEYDNDNGIQTIQNTDSENQMDIHTKEQVSCNNKTLPLSNMVSNPSDKQRTNEMINHNNTGTMRQNNSITESGGVTDFISVTDRTESMSLISQEKAEIAVNISELFHLKKFICSNTELISTGKVAIFFFRNMSIPAIYQEEWWTEAISKVRKSIDQKQTTVAMSIKIEFNV